MADTKTSRNPLVKKLLKDLGNTPVDQPTSVSSETGMDPSKALELIQTALNNHDATQKRWPAPQKIPTFPVYAHGVLVNVPQGKRPGPHPDYIGADDDELLRGAIGTTPQMVAPSPVVPAVPGNTSPLQRALGSPDFITELRKDVHARAGKHRVVPESEHGYLDWDERKAKWMQEQSGDYSLTALVPWGMEALKTPVSPDMRSSLQHPQLANQKSNAACSLEATR